MTLYIYFILIQTRKEGILNSHFAEEKIEANEVKWLSFSPIGISPEGFGGGLPPREKTNQMDAFWMHLSPEMKLNPLLTIPIWKSKSY